ncbi:MAG: hypothetical protein RL311_429 [Bacteroidota bacterium]|jgi:hypothetical protein
MAFDGVKKGGLGGTIYDLRCAIYDVRYRIYEVEF